MSTPFTDVGIDMDGVLYPFINSFRKYCEERLGVLFLSDPVKWNFYEDWGLDEATFQEWIKDAAKSHAVFKTEMPYPTVLEAWELLRKNNIKIHVLTARPQEAWAQTAAWLSQYNLVADSLHFNKTKGFLSKISVGKAALIDDHVMYYNEAKNVGIFPCLLNQPWNQDLEDATRASTLLEFATMIVGYNKVVSLKNSSTFSKTPYKRFTKDLPPWEPMKYEVKKTDKHKNPERNSYWMPKD